ncbi:hypothetical protein F443_22869 [Phytophthora nicotianae P1569]|uniref:Uncharacterized protein n=1 Tax=Phytophthora nicotianae P1569 TaxID=1317065 RepID=V9DVI0_PHYNI|nr:hypothetical protein F443_22869 [Phytophthora nicotianae P1569]
MLRIQAHEALLSLLTSRNSKGRGGGGTTPSSIASLQGAISASSQQQNSANVNRFAPRHGKGKLNLQNLHKLLKLLQK